MNVVLNHMFRACIESCLEVMSHKTDKQTLKVSHYNFYWINFNYDIINYDQQVLCLHGYRQNSNDFKSKSGGFRKLFKNKIEFGIK
jgi:hypothetical protein